MSRSFNPGKEPSFQKIVISSFVLHLVFIALTVIPLVHKKKEIKNYYVSLVNPAVVHRDVVSKVPKKTTVAETKVVEKTKKIETVKEKIKTVPMSTDSLKKRIEDKLKEDEERKEKARKQADIADIKGRYKKEEKADVSSAASNPYAGLKSSDARLLYESDVKDYIEDFWEIPKSIDVEGLEARIEIKIDKDWKIVSYKITTPSGNRTFNDSVIKALFKAKASSKLKPLPEPPLEFWEEAIEEGIELKFYDENSR